MFARRVISGVNVASKEVVFLKVQALNTREEHFYGANVSIMVSSGAG